MHQRPRRCPLRPPGGRRRRGRPGPGHHQHGRGEHALRPHLQAPGGQIHHRPHPGRGLHRGPGLPPEGHEHRLGHQPRILHRLRNFPPAPLPRGGQRGYLLPRQGRDAGRPRPGDRLHRGPSPFRAVRPQQPKYPLLRLRAQGTGHHPQRRLRPPGRGQALCHRHPQGPLRLPADPGPGPAEDPLGLSHRRQPHRPLSVQAPAVHGRARDARREQRGALPPPVRVAPRRPGPTRIYYPR